LFKTIFLFKGIVQPSELEHAKEGLCRAAQYYRAKTQANCATTTIATNCVLILGGNPNDYSVEQLDAFKKACCSYKFVDGVLQKYTS